MNRPIVSVVIPVYNGGVLLEEAIQSVLQQTYTNFEVIIVDDASPQPSNNIVAKFNDPRIKYIFHSKNLGAREARKTGIHASIGEIVAFLDQDDLYHPQKLEHHVSFLQNNFEVGMSYNARFSIKDSPEHICELWRPPNVLTLADIVLGFPVAPSEMVFRREWAIRTEYSEGSWGRSGGEIVLLGRMLFDGCRFGYINLALNYRRFHSGRIFNNLAANCESELSCQNLIMSDPRCPQEVKQLRNEAHKNTYLYFGCRAFAQNETGFGQDCFRNAVQLVPSLIKGNPCPLMEYLVDFVFQDDIQNNEELLRSLMAQLPSEFRWMSNQHAWGIACGYLLKGARAVMWGRVAEGYEYFNRAKHTGAKLDEIINRRLSAILSDYEEEYGASAANKVLTLWINCLNAFVGKTDIRRLKSNYLINQAFKSYRVEDFSKVLGVVTKAITDDYRYIFNRGVLSIIVDSLVRKAGRKLSNPNYWSGIKTKRAGK